MYFSSTFTKDSSVPLELPDYIHSSNYMENVNISKEEVCEASIGLDSNKAMGIDNINPKILKYCALALVLLIYHLFSLTLVFHKIGKCYHYSSSQVQKKKCC